MIQHVVSITYYVMFAVKIGILEMRSAEVSFRVCIHVYKYRLM